MMDALIYLLARTLVALVQALPLRGVARLGRAGGALAYLFDARHRRVALRNLAMCFGREKTAGEIHALAKENFQRIGENFACAAKTAVMSAEALRPHVELTGGERLARSANPPSRNMIVAIGHFGNFELYARFGQFLPQYQGVTTYRGLRQRSLNRLLQELRARSGCLYFERRTEGRQLKAALQQNSIMLGLLADQHAGQSGCRLPFLGNDCSTSLAPAVLALRYRCPLFTGICWRVALGQWRLEIGDEIPTHEGGRPRPPIDVMRDVNRAFEAAVRRDPANWFWVHNRWKTTGREPRLTQREAPETAPIETGG